MKVYLRSFILIIILVFYSCKEKTNNPITNPVENPEPLYKVEGFITYNETPVPSLKITLDSLECLSDSIGYFLFDSLSAGLSRIRIIHPQFITVDTSINIDHNLFFTFNMQNKSDSFLPLMTGHKWYYNPKPDSSGYELVVEVAGIEQIEGLSYYKLLFNQNSDNLIEPYIYYWYMRISNDSLYSYRCDKSGLLLPFNNQLNSFFPIHFCGILYDARICEKSENEIKCIYIADLVMDADFGLTFQKGIGITRYTMDGWYDFILDHYEIYN